MKLRRPFEAIGCRPVRCDPAFCETRQGSPQACSRASLTLSLKVWRSRITQAEVAARLRPVRELCIQIHMAVLICFSEASMLEVVQFVVGRLTQTAQQGGRPSVGTTGQRDHCEGSHNQRHHVFARRSHRSLGHAQWDQNNCGPLCDCLGPSGHPAITGSLCRAA